MSGKVGTGFPSDIAQGKKLERETFPPKRLPLYAAETAKSKKTLTVRDLVPS
jgi:hypothetical protein